MLSEFCSMFHIERGVTAFIGGGGKTSAIRVLAAYLRQYGSVLVCTTTHIHPPADLPFCEARTKPLPFGACVCVGTPEGYKIIAPRQPLAALMQLADYVLVEADGAKHLPLKAHAAHEPVIPDEATAVLAVLGLDGIGKPILEAAHRPALYAALCNTEPDAIVTPALAMQVLASYPRVTGILLNKADTPQDVSLAHTLLPYAKLPVAIVSWQSAEPIKELWRNPSC